MCMIMSFNPFRPLIQNVQELFINNLSRNQQRNDEELECLQFGICAIQVQSPRPEELFLGN